MIRLNDKRCILMGKSDYCMFLDSPGNHRCHIASIFHMNFGETTGWDAIRLNSGEYHRCQADSLLISPSHAYSSSAAPTGRQFVTPLCCLLAAEISARTRQVAWLPACALCRRSQTSNFPSFALKWSGTEPPRTVWASEKLSNWVGSYFILAPVAVVMHPHQCKPLSGLCWRVNVSLSVA